MTEERVTDVAGRRYDIVPGNIQQQIVARSKVAADEDE